MPCRSCVSRQIEEQEIKQAGRRCLLDVYLLVVSPCNCRIIAVAIAIIVMVNESVH